MDNSTTIIKYNKVVLKVFSESEQVIKEYSTRFLKIIPDFKTEIKNICYNNKKGYIFVVNYNQQCI
jgi:hypothetical protein